MIQELMQFVENSKKALEALERKNMKQTESKQVWKVEIFGILIKLHYDLVPGSREKRLHHHGGY